MMRKPINWCAVLGACAIGLAASANAQADEWSVPSAQAPQPKSESLRQMWRSDPAFSQRDGLTDYGDAGPARGAARADEPKQTVRAPQAETRRRANVDRVYARTKSLRDLWRNDPDFSQRDDLTDYGDAGPARAAASKRTTRTPRAETQRRAGADRVDARTRSLRDLWRSDPVFSRRDGLADYGEDAASVAAPPNAEPASPRAIVRTATSNKTVGNARRQQPRQVQPVDPRTAKLRQMWRSDPSLSQPDDLTDY